MLTRLEHFSSDTHTEKASRVDFLFVSFQCEARDTVLPVPCFMFLYIPAAFGLRRSRSESPQRSVLRKRRGIMRAAILFLVVSMHVAAYSFVEVEGRLGRLSNAI